MRAPVETGVVWVTGAGGGLGSALVEVFRERGWHVAASGHTRPPGGDGVRLRTGCVDVTRAETVTAWVEDIEAGWGRLDVLIHNAGVVADGPLVRMSDSEWDRVLEVNLKGAFLCARAVLPGMVRQQSGLILNIASFAGKFGARGQANYAAAKAALIGLTVSLAKEVGEAGVRVNAVLPGVMRTGMTRELSEEALDAFARSNQLRRLNSPRKVAEAVEAITRMEDVSGQVFSLDSRVGRWV